MGACAILGLGTGAPLTCLAINRQGVTLSGAADGTLQLWTAAGACAATVRSSSAVSCVLADVGRDGEEFVSAGRDGRLRLWSCATGTALCELPVHEGPVVALAASRDGFRIFSIGRDWVVVSTKCAEGSLAEIARTALDGPGTQLCLCRAEEVLFVATDSRVVVLNASTLEPQPGFECLSQLLPGLHTLRLSRDSELLAAVGGAAVRLHRAADGALLHHWPSPADVPTALALPSHSSGLVFIGHASGAVRGCVAASGVQGPAFIPEHPAACTALAVSRSGERVAAAFADGAVRLLRGGDLAWTHSLVGHRAGVSCLIASKDGCEVWAGGEEGCLRRWRVDGFAGRAACLTLAARSPGLIPANLQARVGAVVRTAAKAAAAHITPARRAAAADAIAAAGAAMAAVASAAAQRARPQLAAVAGGCEAVEYKEEGDADGPEPEAEVHDVDMNGL